MTFEERSALERGFRGRWRQSNRLTGTFEQTRSLLVRNSPRAEKKLIEIHEERVSNLVTVRLSGIVTKGDIQAETAQIERILEERSSLRLYVDMIGLDGFEAGGAWEEFKLFFRHRDEISRIAFVVSSSREQWAGWIGEMIASGEAREFMIGDEEQAMAWLKRP